MRTIEWRQIKRELSWAFAACLLVVSSANAFDAHPRARTEVDERMTRVFDNEYLDRLFGRARNRESDAQPGSDGLMNGPVPADVNSTVTAPPKPAAEVLPNRSLLTGIRRGTPARRAAALRLAEKGRTSLKAGETRRAIYYLEKALSLDASPYIHFYLARAHYELANYQGARHFLDVAESAFDGQPEWLPELSTMRAALSSPARQAPDKGTVTVASR